MNNPGNASGPVGDFAFVNLVTCTLNAPGLPRVTYNVTQLELDAIFGKFGKPEEMRYNQLETLGPEDEWRNLDQNKVLWMCRCFREGRKVPNPFDSDRLAHIIDIPLLAVTLQIAPTVQAVVPVDGNHRGKARALLGAKTFMRFVVPEEIERDYRIEIREIPR